MLELSNKKEIYDVENQNESMKLSGQTTYTSDKRIIDTNFNVYDLQGQYYGNISYSEMLDDTVNLSLNNVPETMVEAVSDFINQTITSIKEKLEVYI